MPGNRPASAAPSKNRTTRKLISPLTSAIALAIPPGNGNAANPQPRTKPFEDQVARHLAGDVADEERRNTETVGIGGQPQILVHRQRGKAEIDAIDEAQQVEQKHQGQKTAGDLADRRPPDIVNHGVPHRGFLVKYQRLRGKPRHQATDTHTGRHCNPRSLGALGCSTSSVPVIVTHALPQLCGNAVRGGSIRPVRILPCRRRDVFLA